MHTCVETFTYTFDLHTYTVHMHRIMPAVSAVSQNAVLKKPRLEPLTVLHSYSALVCQANQARAAAYLNGFGRWQWELHLHTVLQINNRLLSGPMKRRKHSACSCQPLRALKQMSGRWWVGRQILRSATGQGANKRFPRKESKNVACMFSTRQAVSQPLLHLRWMRN